MADVTIPSDPAVKDPTEASLAAAINAALAALNSNVQVLIDEGVANGSFELDQETSGQPDRWTLTDNNGGTHQLASTVTSEVAHGVRALECVTTSTGWVEALHDEFQPCQPGERIQLEFALRATVSTIRVRGQVLLYDISQNLIATSTLYDENSGNPSTFKKFGGPERQKAITVTGSPRFYKPKLIAGETSGGVPGSVFFDNVRTRIYHGSVPTGRTSKGTISTNTTTTIDISSQIGDDGAAFFAQVELQYSFVDGSGVFTVQGWVAGAWASVLQLTGLGGDEVATVRVPLNDSNQFRIVSTGTGGGDSLDVYLSGEYGV